MDESCRLSSIIAFWNIFFFCRFIRVPSLSFYVGSPPAQNTISKNAFSVIPGSPADAMAHKLHRKIKICESIDTAQLTQTLTFMAMRRCSVSGVAHLFTRKWLEHRARDRENIPFISRLSLTNRNFADWQAFDRQYFLLCTVQPSSHHHHHSECQKRTQCRRSPALPAMLKLISQ